MLGRLFKKSPQGGPASGLNAQHQTQTANLGVSNHILSTGHTQHVPQTPPAVSINTFEDPYTREILYGTQNASQIKAPTPPSNLYRIVISQDGGSFRLKQVLLDTANNEAFEISPSSSRTASHSPSTSFSKSSKLPHKHPGSKPMHGAGELNEYMFGSNLPTHEHHACVKVHILPDINLVAQHAVLLSRVFSIADGESQDDPPPMNSDIGNEWSPKATIKVCDQSGDHLTQLKQIITAKNNFHFSGRFAIGVVVPLESLDDAEDVIFNNWDEISRFLVSLQKLTSKKLISHLTASLVSCSNTHETSDCVVNRRIQFPPFALKLDVDINNQLYKLKKLIYCNSNIPRLINSNALIKSYAQDNEFRLKPMLLHWVLEVLNWLEFRDGKHMAECVYSGHRSSTTGRTTDQKFSFLASLIALLIEYRSLVACKPFGDNDADVREITRIVIMTSNPVVAKRLVFIVNALIPHSSFEVVIKQADVGPDTSTEDASSLHSKDYVKRKETTTNRAGSPSSTSDGTLGTSPNGFDANSVNAVPIPTSSKPYAASRKHDPRSSFSRSFSSAKGWEIPAKTCATTYSNAPQDSFQTGGSLQGIPIAKATLSNPVNDRDCGTFSETSTNAYLSSSLSLSVLSASNYSLSRIGSSFMDKWKNSFSSYGSLNNGSYGALHNALANCAGNAMLLSASTELADYFAPQLSFSSHANRMSILSLRTPSPSPACEPDSLARDELYNSNGGPGYFGASRPGSATVTDTVAVAGTPPPPNGPYHLSRTQSMFDLCSKRRGEVHSQDNSVILEELDPTEVCGEDNVGVDNDLAIQRSRISVFHPLIINNQALNISEQNTAAVKAKCTKIMQLKCMDFTQVLLDTAKVTSNGADGEHADKWGGQASTLGEGEVMHGGEPIVRHGVPLLPNVAFSDEFRPEFGLQSCSVNPKLKGQIMSAMKNDMLFAQNYTRHGGILTRTVLVSLRAREIEVIEMRLNGNTPDETFGIEKSLRLNLSLHNETSSQKLRAHNRYKSRVRKVYSPLNNRGNNKTMQHVQNTFDDIMNLFARQQKQSASKTTKLGISHHLGNNYSKNKLTGSGSSDTFQHDLTKLVMQLL